jgi:hypothetical protein
MQAGQAAPFGLGGTTLYSYLIKSIFVSKQVAILFNLIELMLFLSFSGYLFALQNTLKY